MCTSPATTPPASPTSDSPHDRNNQKCHTLQEDAPVRDSTGAIPLVVSYDYLERVWNRPMPLLFQWRSGGEDRPVSRHTMRRAIEETLQDISMPGAEEPPDYTFHDFRRILSA